MKPYLSFSGKTFFQTKIGFLMSTLDGKYLALESGGAPADIVPALVVPGAPSSAPEVLFTGTNYKGT